MSYLRNLLARTFEPTPGLRPLRSSLATSVAGAGVAEFREGAVFSERAGEVYGPAAPLRGGGIRATQEAATGQVAEALDGEMSIELETDLSGNIHAAASSPQAAPRRLLDPERQVSAESGIESDRPLSSARTAQTETADAAVQRREQRSVSAGVVRRPPVEQLPEIRTQSFADEVEAVSSPPRAAVQSSHGELHLSEGNVPARASALGVRARPSPSRREAAVIAQPEEMQASAARQGTGYLPASAESRPPAVDAGSLSEQGPGSTASSSAMRETQAADGIAARQADLFRHPASMPVATRSYGRRQIGQRTEPQPEHAEPTVHITIGRLEVRGTTPAQAQRQAKSPSAVPSLDDYLKARNRELRRE